VQECKLLADIAALSRRNCSARCRLGSHVTLRALAVSQQAAAPICLDFSCLAKTCDGPFAALAPALLPAPCNATQCRFWRMLTGDVAENANATDAVPDLVLPRDGDPPSLEHALFVHKYGHHCALLPDHTHVLPPAPPPFHAFLDLHTLHYEQERPPASRSDFGPRCIMNCTARAQRRDSHDTRTCPPSLPAETHPKPQQTQTSLYSSAAPALEPISARFLLSVNSPLNPTSPCRFLAWMGKPETAVMRRVRVHSEQAERLGTFSKYFSIARAVASRTERGFIAAEGAMGLCCLR
jgi:hypothetical protein